MKLSKREINIIASRYVSEEIKYDFWTDIEMYVDKINYVKFAKAIAEYTYLKMKKET